MNREYWKLFWTTGMPEAWLMSRDGEETPLPEADQDVPGVQQHTGQPEEYLLKFTRSGGLPGRT